MFKKILIFAFCICLLTSCADSSSTKDSSAASSSSSSISETSITTTDTLTSPTADEPSDKALWDNVKSVVIDEISFPIPDGYEPAAGSGVQNKNYEKLYHGELKIKRLNKLETISDDFLNSEFFKVSYKTDNYYKEIITNNNYKIGLISYDASEGSETWKEARIFINGSLSTFMIKLSGKFNEADFKEYCDKIKYDSTATVTTTTTTSKSETTTTSKSQTTTTTSATTQGISIEYRNALKEALSYLRSSSFSKEGLIHQLEYEKYSRPAAEYAVNNCGANWNEQALKQAQSYLRSSGFSKKGLIKQLEYEKFTSSEAAYGVANCDADWNEQAVKVAKSYLRSSSFSKESLIKQLLYEGFTQAEAQHGADVAYK